MDITIDKENYSVVTTSYGFVTDDDGNTYPFEFVVTEIDGEGIADVEINWDDDEPENVDEIEDEIKLMF